MRSDVIIYWRKKLNVLNPVFNDTANFYPIIFLPVYVLPLLSCLPIPMLFSHPWDNEWSEKFERTVVTYLRAQSSKKIVCTSAEWSYVFWH